MSILNRAKALAEITKISSEVYGLLVDKALAKSNAAKDAKIADLERQLAELKAKAGG